MQTMRELNQLQTWEDLMRAQLRDLHEQGLTVGPQLLLVDRIVDNMLGQYQVMADAPGVLW